MQILFYFLIGFFIVLALAMMFAYQRTGDAGIFLLGITYGAAAALAIMFFHWWPLVVGFALVLVWRALGFDPETRRRGPPK